MKYLLNEKFLEEIQKNEKTVLKKVMHTAFDRLILTEEEYKQLMSYSFDSKDELRLATEALFHAEKESRLFTNHLVIEVNKNRYYYIFDDEVQKLQVCKFEKNELHINGFLDYKTNIFDVNLDIITGSRKLQELSIKIAKNLLAFPIKNLANQNEIMSNQMIKEFQRLAQEAVDLLTGVAHHVLTYKEIRVITPEDTHNSSSFTSKSTRTNLPRQQKNNPQIIKLSKIIYQREGNSTTNVQKRERHYHISEWEVRGHWREYKNGKKIWIKPHKKGPKNSDKSTSDDKKNKPKIYKLK